MKALQEIKQIISAHKRQLADDYHVSTIGIFGSYVSGLSSENSDIDILVEFEKPVGFVKFIRLENYLSNLIGVKVDLVTKKALKPYMGQNILRELESV
jgi:uncharacterized protein